MAKGKKYYVVWRGKTPGIYTDWQEVRQQIDGFAGARYKGFMSQEEAKEAYSKDPKPLPGYITNPPQAQRPTSKSYEKMSVAVDAACSGNPGKMEYRGISLWDNKQIFHHAHELGTNNIGEFLGIVEALARLKKAGREDIVVYSDSMTAISWVRHKKCRTKLMNTHRTAELLNIVERAEKWLQENTFANPIIKWPTEDWGEIPADFGRK